MSARSTGVLLLALAVLALVVSPRSRAVSGSAVRLPVPPVPVVGDCLRVSPEYVTWDWDALAVHSDDELPLAPCTGSRFGEVVQLRTDDLPDLLFDDPVDPGRAKDWLAAAGGSCALEARVRLGLSGAVNLAGWQPVAPVVTFFLRPLREQVAAGQRWMACVATVDGAAGRPLDRLMLSGTPRDGFGTCMTDPVNRGSVACTAPHRSELFGRRNWPADATPTQAELTASCRSLLSTMLGRSDVTAGGQLLIDVPAWHFERPDTAPPLGLRAGLGGFADCGLSAPPPKTLAGALLLLRNQPIPWA